VNAGLESLVDSPLKTMQNEDSSKLSAAECNFLTSPSGFRGEPHMSWYLRERFRPKDKMVGGRESPFPVWERPTFFYKSPFYLACLRRVWLTTDLVLGSDIWADYSDECSDVRTIEIRSNIKVNGKIGLVWMIWGLRMKSAWRAAC
jgi:hypothetical protein